VFCHRRAALAASCCSRAPEHAGAPRHVRATFLALPFSTALPLATGLTSGSRRGRLVVGPEHRPAEVPLALAGTCGPRRPAGGLPLSPLANVLHALCPYCLLFARP